MWRIQWWSLFFLYSFGIILVWENCFKKIKFVCWSWNLKLKLIRICETRWWFSFFSSLDRKYPFWVNLVQKFKIVCLNWILIPRLFRMSKFDGDVHFFCFRPFSASFLEKSIWHFGVTWLIFRQFPCRDVKPVAFLVSVKRWKISSRQPSFWFLW